MKDASTRGYKQLLIEALQEFRCYKDDDVQDFLNNKAIDFENRGWATTYLFLDKDEYQNNNSIKIEGYFSLTYKALIYGNITSSKRQKISGTKKASAQSFVLIGQLGKYMTDNETSELDLKEILNNALFIISQSSKYIENRNVIIECKPIEKIKNLYTNYGFSDLQYDNNLHTLYLKLENSIKF